MQISAEWVSAVVGALGLGFLAGGSVQKRRDAIRNSEPIVRAIWRRGELGFTVSVQLVNRLNEDLYVTTAECRSRFIESIPGTYDPSTSTVSHTEQITESPMGLDWIIPPNSRDLRSFVIDGADAKPWVRLTVSSSSKTLSSKQMIVTDKGLTPSHRKGLKRLAMVYFAIAAIIGLWGWYLIEAASNGWLEASKGDHYPEMTYYSGLSATGIRFVEIAFLMGIALPVLVAVVGGIAFWIYRGFKPHPGE